VVVKVRPLVVVLPYLRGASQKAVLVMAIRHHRS